MTMAFLLIACLLGVFLLRETWRYCRGAMARSGSLVGVGEILDGLALSLRFGSPLHQAVTIVDPALPALKSSGYLVALCSSLSKGLSYPEALDIARGARATPLDNFLHLVMSRVGSGPETLAQALGKIVRLVGLAARYERQERARTTQSRVQFWVVSTLVPLLGAFNVLAFPELFFETIQTPVGSVCYGAAILFFCSGIWLFFRLQGRTFAFLLSPLEREPRQGVTKRLSLLGCLSAGDQVVRAQTSALGFLSTLEVALVSGHNLRDALEVACHVFPDCALAAHSTYVLERESRGEKLLDAFVGLRSQPDDAARQLVQVARGARERSLLVETVAVLAERSREHLGELSEERLGHVGVQMLVPLCLCLLPATLLVLLAPIFHLVQRTLSSSL